MALIRRALPPLLDVAPDAVVLLVTNPVDVVTYVAQEISGLPSRPGDRQRHRARHVAAAPPARRAPRCGRHQRPRRWSSASTATARSCSGRRPPSAARRCSTSSAPTVNGWIADELDGLLHEVRTAAYEIIAGKGGDEPGDRSGHGAHRAQRRPRRAGRAARQHPHRRSTASATCACRCRASSAGQGVLSRLAVPMDETERAGLRASAAAIRAVIDSVC